MFTKHTGAQCTSFALCSLKNYNQQKEEKWPRQLDLNSQIRHDSLLSFWLKQSTLTTRLESKLHSRSYQSLPFVKRRKEKTANYGSEDLLLTHFVCPVMMIHISKPLTPLTVTTQRKLNYVKTHGNIHKFEVLKCWNQQQKKLWPINQ